MDIKDSYLHGTVGVVKSISVTADKLTYKLADKDNTSVDVTLPLATQSANGLLSKGDKTKLDNLVSSVGDYVTRDTDQTITGVKTFTNQLKFTVAQGTAPFLVTSTTKVTNLNADLLDGYHLNSVLPLPAYSYTSGYLVQTDIATESNTMITFRIEGNSYGYDSILTTGHFYNYKDNNSILNASAIHHGYDFGNIIVFCYNNLVHLWFALQSNYLSFIVYVYGTNVGTSGVNRVTSITNSTLPTSGVSRLVEITPIISIGSNNYTSYVNTTNFPGLNKVGTVTSVAVANGGGLSVSGSPITSSGTITITNTGVRSISTGTTNGTISVNTNGTSADVAVKGLNSAAYTSKNDYAVRKTLSDEDLNSVTTPGFYNAGGGNTCANKPSGVEHFGMYVIHCAGGTYYVQILFEESNSTRQWRRHCLYDTWSDWTLDKLTDTTYGVVSSSANGLAPKVINTNTATVGSTYYVLASTNGSATPSWYKLPTTAFANDDTKVTQTNTTGSADYRILFSGNANDTTETTTARKSANLKFNPNTGVLSTKKLNVGDNGGSWISGMTNAAILYNALTALNSDRYHPIIAIKTNGEHVFNFGAYVNSVGFCGFKKGRTENSYDWRCMFDVETGALSTSSDVKPYINNVANLGSSSLKWANVYATSFKGNADTATKLATKRKLWGLNFDGTADVSGSLTGVSHLTASGQITAEVFYGKGSLGGAALYAGHREGLALGIEPYDKDGNWLNFGIQLFQDGNVSIGTTTNYEKLYVNGNVKATSFIGKIDGTYVNKLTGYTKATTKGAIADTDTLNVALGKLEFKADAAYDLVKGAYDGDGTIENLAEILRVLSGIKDTETIQAIIGKYLPLAGGHMTGNVTWETGTGHGTRLPAHIYRNSYDNDGRVYDHYYRPGEGYTNSIAELRVKSGTSYRTLRFGGDGGFTWMDYNVLHANNYTSYTVKKDGTGASGTWNIDIYGKASRAVQIDTTSIKTEQDIVESGLRTYAGSGQDWTGSIKSMLYAAIIALGGPSRGLQMWARRGTGVHSSIHYRVGKEDTTGWEAERTLLDNYNSSVTGTSSSITVNLGGTSQTLTIPSSLPANGGNAATASKVTCTEASSNLDRPIVGTNMSNSLYYTQKATVNLSTGHIKAGALTINSVLDYSAYPETDTLKMGTTIGSIHFNGDLEDKGSALTWGYSSYGSADSGIYVKHNGSYGSKMYFATTNVFNDGPKAAMLIDNVGDIYALRKRFNGNLRITSTTQERHIEFSRVEYNYITAPDGGTISFNARGTVYAVDGDLNITKGIIKPGKTNTTSLGTSGLRWSNIYSVLGNFSGQITSTVATGTAPFAISSTTKVDNLNADLLDGLHGEWYRKNTIGFTATGTSADEEYDCNTLRDGIIYNYVSTKYWKNAPDGMSYGQVLNLRRGNAYDLMGLLAWDVLHNSTADTTHYLWWRASDDGSLTEAKWHRIAYIEDIPTITDYYWANVKISSSSSTTTAPTFGSVTTSTIKTNNATLYLRYNNDDTKSICLNGSAFLPTNAATDKIDLGASSNRWKSLYTSKLYIDNTGKLRPIDDNSRSAGVYGVYDPTKVGHVWSMGSYYKISDDGLSTGNMYGLVYFYTDWSNSTVYNTATRDDKPITEVGNYAFGHLIAMVSNGKVMASLGNYVWSRYGFKKLDSSDSYVLLGGGGHKTISSLSVASATTANSLKSSTIVADKALSLVNTKWTDVDGTYDNLAAGTYAVQVTSGTTLVASGIMSYKNSSDTAGDEIPLHVHSTVNWRPYLRTYGNKLLISSNDTSATSRTVTIKIALIL